MRSSIISILLLLTCTMLCTHCASEALPGGGPPDKIPPQVIFQTINNAATNVDPQQSLTFTFSERLNPDKIEKNISMFPLKDDLFNISYKNKSIEISPTRSWEKDAIYTLIFEKGLSDLRSNSLREPFQFTFTTGSYMPDNAIKGQILDMSEKKTAKIYLSRNYSSPDSIILSPEYFTQSGPDGSFSFEHMPDDTFYIAAYIDEDKSNSYKKEFDLPCIPQQSYVVADTLGKSFLLQAVIDNFLSGRLIKAESISPCETVLNFSKILSPNLTHDQFHINGALPDTVIYDEKFIKLYHKEIESDSLVLSFTNILDQLGETLSDSTLKTSTTAWVDNFFHFETFDKHLRIYPNPNIPELAGEFHSNDTSMINLKKEIPGFYQLPELSKDKNGKFKLDLSAITQSDSLETDTLYSIDLNLKPKPEYGRVLAFLDKDTDKNIRFILMNNKNDYECSASGTDIIFENILPGTYTLYFYDDRNENSKKDYGKLEPFIAPEFKIKLDTEINVKARWDTELAEAFKIDIENK